jgi:hypothetical protein
MTTTGISVALRRGAVIAICAMFVIAAAFLTARPTAARGDTVSLAPGSTIALTTPAFIQAGKRYAFTWPGGGPPQTYTVKMIRPDGWILVDVAEENVDPAFLVPGQTPARWLHVGIAVSIQEMRPLLYQ